MFHGGWGMKILFYFSCRSRGINSVSYSEKRTGFSFRVQFPKELCEKDRMEVSCDCRELTDKFKEIHLSSRKAVADSYSSLPVAVCITINLRRVKVVIQRVSLINNLTVC